MNTEQAWRRALRRDQHKGTRQAMERVTRDTKQRLDAEQKPAEGLDIVIAVRPYKPTKRPVIDLSQPKD